MVWSGSEVARKQDNIIVEISYLAFVFFLDMWVIP